MNPILDLSNITSFCKMLHSKKNFAINNWFILSEIIIRIENRQIFVCLYGYLNLCDKIVLDACYPFFIDFPKKFILSQVKSSQMTLILKKNLPDLTLTYALTHKSGFNVLFESIKVPFNLETETQRKISECNYPTKLFKKSFFLFRFSEKSEFFAFPGSYCGGLIKVKVTKV
ncbi:hypothetical protein BpHYR1_051121 [Brachionus plicatilis]|uniref:Uncharacterized protein n=1 Tax=Brachionus plicatilis TaxID=10195 RepID=A0A3M7PGM4_BRAPC|nr:hypothetical protein BpHYR1_051121 [Brachionus plicatilis]